jgi:hypothetical protein
MYSLVFQEGEIRSGGNRTISHLGWLKWLCSKCYNSMAFFLAATHAEKHSLA